MSRSWLFTWWVFEQIRFHRSKRYCCVFSKQLIEPHIQVIELNNWTCLFKSWRFQIIIWCCYNKQQQLLCDYFSPNAKLGYLRVILISDVINLMWAATNSKKMEFLHPCWRIWFVIYGRPKHTSVCMDHKHRMCVFFNLTSWWRNRMETLPALLSVF